MRNILLAGIFTILVTGLSSQNDSIKLPKKKPAYTYLGIQANPLIQQFLSFNSNTTINNNPFTFSYAKNNLKTGAGFAFGTGLNVSNVQDNDGVSSISITKRNFAFRFGYEKKYLQEERFIPFWGIDFNAGATYNEVTSVLNQVINPGFVRVSTTRVFLGPSFRSGVHLRLSKNILLGTEFFFNLQLAYTESNNGGLFSTSVAPFDLGFQLPTAIFLIFRF